MVFISHHQLLIDLGLDTYTYAHTHACTHPHTEYCEQKHTHTDIVNKSNLKKPKTLKNFGDLTKAILLSVKNFIVKCDITVHSSIILPWNKPLYNNLVRITTISKTGPQRDRYPRVAF